MATKSKMKCKANDEKASSEALHEQAKIKDKSKA